MENKKTKILCKNCYCIYYANIKDIMVCPKCSCYTEKSEHVKDYDIASINDRVEIINDIHNFDSRAYSYDDMDWMEEQIEITNLARELNNNYSIINTNISKDNSYEDQD